jgi:RNA polymerase sigma-70 factor, ECF subfamily
MSRSRQEQAPFAPGTRREHSSRRILPPPTAARSSARGRFANPSPDQGVSPTTAKTGGVLRRALAEVLADWGAELLDVRRQERRLQRDSTKWARRGSYALEVPRSEADLLAQIESLYRAAFPDFVAVAASILGERDAARDAVQDAFASVVRSRGRFRGEAPLEAWVWRAVINAAHKKRQRQARQAHAHFQAAGVSMNGSAPRGDGSDVASLLAALPERQRLVLFLRYYADLDYRAIADILEVTVGTVSATLHAAHSTLRRTLSEVPHE